MSKKVREVPVILGSKGIMQPSFEEIKWMLRAADSLILSGGRTLLTKIRKGSKEKKILELNLDKNPAYGYLKSLFLSLNNFHLQQPVSLILYF